MPKLAWARSPKKEKVSISIDANLLQMVDAFVAQSKDTSISRSYVFELALRLWRQEQRDLFDEKYYSENADRLKADNQSWTAVTTEAAKHIWKD